MERVFQTAEGSIIRFEWKDVQNNFLTEKMSKQVFDKVLIGYVSATGQKKSEVANEFLRRDVNGGETRKNPRAWERYGVQAEKYLNKADDFFGTSLDKLEGLTPRQVALLQELNVMTIEQLANLSEMGLNNIGMGARDMQAKAVYHMKNSASQNAAAEAAKLKEEQEQFKEQMKSQADIIADLQEQLAALESEKIPKQRKSAK
jgi:hypothetical protein